MKKKILILALVLGTMVGTVSAYDSPSSEKLFYHFNESSSPAQDYSGNNYDGEWYGGLNPGATGTSFNDGVAYSFDGSNDFVNTTINNMALASSGTKFGVSAWIKPDSETNGNAILNKGGEWELGYSSGHTSNNKISPIWVTYGDNTGQVGNLSLGEWHHVVVTGTSGDSLAIYLNNKEVYNKSYSDTSSDSGYDLQVGRKYDSGGDGRYISGDIDEPRIFKEKLSESEISNLYNCNKITSCNSPPSFDSVSTSPSSWTFESDVNVSANVSDSDGNVSSVSADVWENGSQIVNDASLNDSDGDGTWEIDNLFTVDESNVYYNYTLTATDNDGATSTYEESQFIKDKPPKYSINKLQNKTYFKYDQKWEIDVKKDGDNVKDEKITCTLYKDGNQTAEFSGIEPFVESGTLSSDLGSHDFESSCKDPGGHTNNKTLQYTVDNYQVQSTSSTAHTYETENTTYSIQVKLGEMTNYLTADLWFNSVKQSTEKQDNAAGINTYTLNLHHQPLLVSTNATNKNWYFDATANYTKFQSNNTTTETTQTNSKTQSIWWAYYTQNSTTEQDKYIEQSTATYTNWLEWKFDNVNTDKKEAYLNLTSQTNQMSAKDEKSGRRFQADFDLGDLDQTTKTTAKVNSTVKIEFGSSSRKITASDKFQVYKIQVTGCGGSGTKALVLTTYAEHKLNKKIKSDLSIALEAWNPEEPGFKRSFNFTSTNTTTHNFCIKPSFAEYRISTIDKKIEYEGSSDDYNSRSYYIINETISSSVTNIPLYLNYKNRTREIEFKVVDSENDPVPKTLIKVERYFPGKDKYIPVEVLKTGSQGLAYGNLKQGDTTYQFKLYDRYTLVQQEPDSVIPEDLSLLFELGDKDKPAYFENIGAITYNCKSNTTRVSCSYSSDTERLENMTLDVEKKEAIGFSKKCSVSSTSTSGELVCDGLNTSKNKYKYELLADFTDSTLTVDSGWLGQVTANYGDTGLMLSFMLFITISFAGLWKPEASLAMGAIGLTLSYLTGFLAVSQTAFISVVALAAVLIWRMS